MHAFGCLLELRHPLDISKLIAMHELEQGPGLYERPEQNPVQAKVHCFNLSLASSSRYPLASNIYNSEVLIDNGSQTEILTESFAQQNNLRIVIVKLERKKKSN